MKLSSIVQFTFLTAPMKLVASQNIAEVAGSLPNFSTLVELVTIESEALNPVLNRLTGDTPTTVFAPTNDAFAELPEATVSYLKANPDVLAQVLLYHAVDGAIPSTAIDTEALSLPTLLPGASIVAEKRQNGLLCFIGILCQEDIYINDSIVDIPDVSASNGVIHAIDKVLAPPEVILLDIVDTAIEQHLGTLVAAVAAAGLVDFLRSPGPKTVFAPSEEAWNNLPAGFLDSLLLPQNVNLLSTILQYHVLDGAEVDSASIDTTTDITMANRETATVSFDGTDIVVNDATVIAADIQTSNGIVHVIDKILVPPDITLPKDIVDLAVSDPELTSLVDSLVEAQLVSTLDTPGPYTVLAPTNAAFDALGDLPRDGSKLQEILLYHVIPGQVLAETIVTLDSAATLAEKSVSIRVENGKVFVDGAQVIETDIIASNGVIHKIDAVLMPPKDEEPESDCPYYDFICDFFGWL